MPEAPPTNKPLLPVISMLSPLDDRFVDDRFVDDCFVDDCCGR
jgi:hypothetical protein